MATEPGPAGHSQLKPTLRKAERLSAVHTPEGLPLPPNAVADVQRNTRGWLCCQLDQRYRGSSSETFKAARDRAVSPRNCSTSARPALMIVGAATEATEAHRRAEPIVRMQSPPAVSLRTTGSSAANTPELSGFEQGTDLRHPQGLGIINQTGKSKTVVCARFGLKESAKKSFYVRQLDSGSLQRHSRCSAPHRIEARVLP